MRVFVFSGAIDCNYDAYAILSYMKRGGDTRLTQGFTIVETLIVLAVTGSLFVSAALLINGKQNKSDFLVGSRAISQQLQEIINQTQTGYYPHNGSFTCDSSLAYAPNVKITTGGSIGLGENDECIFAGTTVVFNSAAAQNTSFKSYALAAARTYDNSGKIVDVDSPAVARVTAIPQTVENHTIVNGLTYYGGRYKGDLGWNFNRFPVAFLSGFADFGGDDAGAQRIELRKYTVAWGAGTTDVENTSKIDAEAGQPTPYDATPISGIELCFASGGTDQSVLVTVNNGLMAGYEIRSGATCS
jgi:type II secretory pathway pseudopilin PulG